MATMYQRRSLLTPQQQSKFIKLFVAGGATARGARLPCSGFSSAGARFSPPSSPTPAPAPCCRSSRRRSRRTAIVYTVTFKAYNALDVSDFRHGGSITQSSLPTVRTTSKGLRISGTRTSATCGASMESRRRTSTGS